MKIHFSSSTKRTRSYFFSKISRDRDSCQGLEGPSTNAGFHGNFSRRRGWGGLSKAIWNFSENSSILEGGCFPYDH